MAMLRIPGQRELITKAIVAPPAYRRPYHGCIWSSRAKSLYRICIAMIFTAQDPIHELHEGPDTIEDRQENRLSQ